MEAEGGQRLAHAGRGTVLGGHGPAVAAAVEKPHLRRARRLIDTARRDGEGETCAVNKLLRGVPMTDSLWFSSPGLRETCKTDDTPDLGRLCETQSGTLSRKGKKIKQPTPGGSKLGLR